MSTGGESDICPGHYMERVLYEELCKELNDDPESIKRVFGLYPNIPENTINAIWHRLQRSRCKRQGIELKRRGVTEAMLLAEYERILRQLLSDNELSEVLNRLNSIYGLTPCVMMRLLIKAALPERQKETTAVLLDPGSHFKSASACLWKRILYTHLERSCYWSLENDAVNAPHMDEIRHRIGREGEIRLEEGLKAAGLSFLSESQLKQDGYGKTPDALMIVPIGLPEYDFVACWWESKAGFGDDEVFGEHVMEQLQYYRERYGPGVVIYWDGHVKMKNQREDILVLSEIPKEFIFCGS